MSEPPTTAPTSTSTSVTTSVAATTTVPTVDVGSDAVVYAYSNLDTGGLVRVDSSGPVVLAELQPGPDDAVLVGDAIWLAGKTAQIVSLAGDVTPLAVPEATNAVEFDGRFAWFVAFAGEMYRVDPSDGAIVRFDPPSYPSYLTTDGNGAVFAVMGPVGLATDVQIMRGDQNGVSVVGSVELSDPNVVDSDVTGLFYAHGSLWLLANRVTELWRIDPTNAAVTARVPVGQAIPLVDVGGQWSLEAGYALDIVAPDGDSVVALFRHYNADLYSGVTSFPIDADALGSPKLVRIDPATSTVVSEASLASERDCATPMAASSTRLWGSNIIGAPCVIDFVTGEEVAVAPTAWTEIGFGPFPAPTAGRLVAVVPLP